MSLIINPYALGLSGTAWTPANTTTDLWLDAQDTASITLAAGVISQWADKSGNARHATNADTTKRPALDAAGMNSIQAVSFSGTEKYLQVPRGFITSGFTAIIMHREGAANSRLLDQRGTGAFGSAKGWYVKNYQAVNSDIAGADQAGGNYRGVDVSGMSNAVKSTSIVFPVSGGMQAFWNGAAIGTPTSGGTTPTDLDNTGLNIRIGGNAAGGTTQDFVGWIGEIILIAGAATTDVRQKIEGYMHHRWGAAGILDASHPYKTAPPYV